MNSELRGITIARIDRDGSGVGFDAKRVLKEQRRSD